MPTYFFKSARELLTPWLWPLGAAGAGIAMGLTVAPTEAWGLGWVALAPLWVLVRQSPKPLWSAWAWGMGYHGLVLSWITGIHPMTWMGVPWATSLTIALVCWLVISLWGSALVLLWAILWRWVDRLWQLNLGQRLLLGTGLWCALEWLWSQGDLWWSSLSLTQSPHNLVVLHLAQLSGATAVTALLVAVNGAIGEAWLARADLNRAKLIGVVAVGLWLGGHGLGYALYRTPLENPPSQALEVGIIQGNIPNTIKLYAEGRQRAQTGYARGYRELAAAGVQAVLTPEGALPFYPQQIKNTDLYRAVLDQQVPLWLGAFGEAGGNYANSLQAIDGAGNFVSSYSKHKLVPLGEYVPLQQWIGRWVKRLSPLDAHLQAGAAEQEFWALPQMRAAVGICYESAFGEHLRRQAREGELLLTSSNNAHYAANMPAQHHAQDVMRAIETSRWTVRATNTGYSGIVDPHGHTLWKSPLNEFATHHHRVYRRREQTLYLGWGDWLTPALVGGGLGWGWLRRR